MKDFNPQDHLQTLPDMDITYKGGLFIPGAVSPWNKGKKGLHVHSKETRQKMSDAKKGKIPYEMTQKTREKIREIRTGTTASSESKIKVSKSLNEYYKNRTEEERQKKSDSLKEHWKTRNKVWTEEQRQNKRLPDNQVTKQALYARKWRERQRLLKQS